MESFFIIVLVAFNIWTIYFYNKLLYEVANQKEEEELPPVAPVEVMGKSLFKMPHLQKKEEAELKPAESESVSENDVTFEDTSKGNIQLPDEQLDNVFMDVRIEDAGMSFSDDEDDADVPQAKGTSFDDIDVAVKTVKSSRATDLEKRHTGKVFHEMDGNQLYEKFMENNKECKKNIHDFVSFYLQGHKVKQNPDTKKEFKVPDNIEDFNILDFV